MSDRMDTCAACRFWERQPNVGDGHGACRRHAPTLIDLSYVNPNQPEAGRQPSYESAWPLMRSEAWCGDFEPRRG